MSQNTDYERVTIARDILNEELQAIAQGWGITLSEFALDALTHHVADALERANADDIAQRANAAGDHLPDGFVDDGYVCDACIAEYAAEDDSAPYRQSGSEDEDDHRYNSAPFCGRCGGPCQMQNDKSEAP